MALKNTQNSYGTISKLFHWIFFFAFIGMFILAEIMDDMPKGDERYAMYDLHKSIGITLLALVTLRLFWQFINTKVKPIAQNAKEVLVAKIMHIALYVLMFTLPISGYVMSMAGGYGINLFGMWSVPNLLEKNKVLFEIAHEVHEFAAEATYIVVGLHIVAALIHHFIKKDDTLKRMTHG